MIKDKVTEKVGNTTYYKLDYGTSASIAEHRNGTATLRIKLYTGQLVENKKYNSIRGAKIALGKWC